MKKLFKISLVFLIICGCTKTHEGVTNACGQIDPLSIEWVNQLKKSITNCECYTSILKAKYKGEIVFFIGVTDGLCNSLDLPTLYNCEGKEIKRFQNGDEKEVMNDVVNRERIFTCKK